MRRFRPIMRRSNLECRIWNIDLNIKFVWTKSNMNLLQSVFILFSFIEKECIQRAGPSTVVHGFELDEITRSEVERSTTGLHSSLFMACTDKMLLNISSIQPLKPEAHLHGRRNHTLEQIIMHFSSFQTWAAVLMRYSIPFSLCKLYTVKMVLNISSTQPLKSEMGSTPAKSSHVGAEYRAGNASYSHGHA